MDNIMDDCKFYNSHSHICTALKLLYCKNGNAASINQKLKQRMKRREKND